MEYIHSGTQTHYSVVNDGIFWFLEKISLLDLFLF